MGKWKGERAVCILVMSDRLDAEHVPSIMGVPMFLSYRPYFFNVQG